MLRIVLIKHSARHTPEDTVRVLEEKPGCDIRLRRRPHPAVGGGTDIRSPRLTRRGQRKDVKSSVLPAATR